MINPKKAWFMLAKFWTDMRRWYEKGYELPDDFHSKKLGYYYFLFDENRIASGKDQKLISKFDENGIPINKTYVDVEDQEFVYFPISIGQLGLAVFHTYLKTKNEEDKVRFLSFADWFVMNASHSEKLGAIWYTDVELPAYRRKKPWPSAFSQSRGISILLRAYQLTGRIEYSVISRDALTPFLHNVSNGGVVSDTQWGPFYEEYPASEEPTLVLNGHIFALWGIFDYLRVFPESEAARKIFDDGMSTLEKILPEFDLGFWSRYNLCKADWYPDVDPATIGYQKLHIGQLEIMNKIIGSETCKNYAGLFKKQLSMVNVLRMYRLKYRSLKRIGRL